MLAVFNVPVLQPSPRLGRAKGKPFLAVHWCTAGNPRKGHAESSRIAEGLHRYRVEAERPRIIGHGGQAADNHGFFTEGNEENEGFRQTLCSLCYLLLKVDQRMTQRGFDFTTEETELAETYPANPVWFFFLLAFLIWFSESVFIRVHPWPELFPALL